MRVPGIESLEEEAVKIVPEQAKPDEDMEEEKEEAKPVSEEEAPEPMEVDMPAPDKQGFTTQADDGGDFSNLKEDEESP